MRTAPPSLWRPADGERQPGTDVLRCSGLRPGRRGRNGHERVRAAVVEEPAAVKEDQPFGEGGAGGVLAGLLPGHSRLKNRLIGLREEMCGMVGIEESFTGSVGTGGQS